jgi:NAD+ diphosphatase
MPTDPVLTFTQSGLDRAANLREATAQARVLADPAARTCVLWRGKPLLMAASDPLRLVWVPLDHAMLADAREAPVFIGLDGTAPRYARDISAWADRAADEAAMAGFLDPSGNRHPAAPEGAEFLDLRASMARMDAGDAGTAAMAKGVLGWHETHGHCARCGAPSQMSLAGWRRTCTACGTHHFPRTDPVVIMLIERGNRLLLGRSPGWPEGMYSLLAGFMEPGETIEAAVRREVAEETGVTVGNVGYVASQPWPFPASLMIGCWGMAATDAITLDPAELEDARWVSREALVEGLAGRDPGLKPARRGAIARHLIELWLKGRLVPGAADDPS